MEEDEKKYIESYNKKFKNLLSPEESYQFMLKAQFLLPKISIQSDIIFYTYIKYIISHLCKVTEGNEPITFLDLAFETFIEKRKVEDLEKAIITWIELYKKLPIKCDKSNFKINFISFCVNNKIDDTLLNKHNIYALFAEDSLANKYYIQYYRFSIKSQELNKIIDSTIHLLHHEIEMKGDECFYFIARTCFEILLLKNAKLANLFISYFITQYSHPVINLALGVSCFLLNMEGGNDKTISHLEDLADDYKKIFEFQKDIKAYLNQIGLIYFNAKIVEDSSPFSFLNIFKALAG